METKLAELEHIYRTAPVGLCLLDLELRYVRINQELADINGKPIDDHIGKRLRDVIPAIAPRIEPLLRQVIETGKPIVDTEVTGKAPAQPDGERTWLVDYHPLRSEDGTVRGISSVVRDVTDIKTLQQITRNEERLRLLLESTKAIPWEAETGTWHFTYVGPQAADLLGYPIEAWYQEGFWRDHIHPNDREHAVNYCVSQTEAGADHELEYRMLAADDRIVWIHDITVVSQMDTPPTVRGFLIDITERKQAEENLRLSNLRLRQLREEIGRMARITSMGELTAALSHELNQPLCSMVSNAQAALRFLRGPSPDVEESSRAIGDIAREGQRVGEMIHRIRDLLAKGESQISTLDLNALIREVMPLVNPEPTMRVRTELADNLPRVAGDRVQLQQVVLNLIQNGIEAARENGPPHEVIVRTFGGSGPMVTMEFVDRGRGIPTENLPRVFEAFFTTKAEGMGMGLSTSHTIIQAHEGQITARNNPDGGATFQVRLPRAEDTVS